MRRRIRLDSFEQLGSVEWDAVLHASGKPFRFSHRAAAGQALAAVYPSYEFAPVRVDYDDGTRLLLPLVAIRRRIPALTFAMAMPLDLEGTPIALEGSPSGEHLKALFRRLDGYGGLQIFGGAGGSPPKAGVVSIQATHVLDLTPGYEEIWSRSFPAKTRNMCRKAERAGLTVAPDSSAEAVASYQELYRASALGWGYKEPPYPDRLFASLLSCEHAELWLARKEEAIVAGAVMLRGSDDLLYWSGAINREFRHLAPSNAIIRAVIEDACRRGIGYLDFGASSGLSGVEAFKRSFGAQARGYRTVFLETRRYRHLERALRHARHLKAGAT